MSFLDYVIDIHAAPQVNLDVAGRVAQKLLDLLYTCIIIIDRKGAGVVITFRSNSSCED